jgi:hypothetical protein
MGDVEVADVFRQYGPAYRQTRKLPVNQLRTMHAIEICRTAELGGHVDQCDCGHTRISYNSCRNRHCPKCQFLRKEKWIEARQRDLLPIPYFHVVFTIPDSLNPLALRNQEIIYGILFKATKETLLELGKRLGRIGFICILHTWGQNLTDHPHIHCIVTGGGLSGTRWVSSRKKFFLPAKVMSRLFKGKFLFYLTRAYDKLSFAGNISCLKEKDAFRHLLSQLYEKDWVVSCKPPFKGPETVIEYLGRYTHRVAITNHRIIGMEDGEVSFFWKDYADGSKTKVMTLDAGEFIRRFLLHVLPGGFVKIRHYGLLGNRNRKEYLALCRKALGATVQSEQTAQTWQELLLAVAGIDIMECPICHGRMRRKEILCASRYRGPPQGKA